MQNSTGIEDYSAGTALSMPFRLLSWEITYYSTRDFTLPPTTSRLGCSEGSAPLPEAPPPFFWIKRPSKRERGPPALTFCLG